jgi:hypothetical protein
MFNCTAGSNPALTGGGVVTDENLVKKHNGTIVERKGELPAKTP